jgi:hypothetical protein
MTICETTLCKITQNIGDVANPLAYISNPENARYEPITCGRCVIYALNSSHRPVLHSVCHCC